MSALERSEKAPLRSLAIEWVDNEVCLDTFENRAELRRGGWTWEAVPASDTDNYSTGTGLIEVTTPEKSQNRMLHEYGDILLKPGNAWSDYISPLDLPLDVSTLLVPYAVHRAAAKHRAWEDAPPEARTKQPPYLPCRCKAILSDGTRCWKWALTVLHKDLCRGHAPTNIHLTTARQSLELARAKMTGTLPAMAEILEELATSASSEQVRLKAATEIMDRVGLHASSSSTLHIDGEIVVEHVDAAQLVRERLSSLAEKMRPPAELETAEPAADTVIEGVVVEDE